MSHAEQENQKDQNPTLEMLCHHRKGTFRASRVQGLRDRRSRSVHAGIHTAHHQGRGKGHREDKVQLCHPQIQIRRNTGQGVDRPAGPGKNGGRFPPDRGTLGGTGFNLTQRHRHTEREIFRNKGSHIPA